MDLCHVPRAAMECYLRIRPPNVKNIYKNWYLFFNDFTTMSIFTCILLILLIFYQSHAILLLKVPPPIVSYLAGRTPVSLVIT